MKKILIILLIILIPWLLGWYFFIQDRGEGDNDVSGESVGFFGGLFSDDRTVDLGDDEDRFVFPDDDGDFGFFGGGDGDLIKAESGGVTLQQLTNVPVAGAISVSETSRMFTDADVVRYVERGSGNVYEVNLETLESERLTNTTIPGIYEVFWHKDAENLVLRYLDDNDVIKTFSARISTNSSAGMLDGRFMSDDIDFMGTDVGGENLFYTIRGDRETLLRQSSFDVGGGTVVYRSLLHELLFQAVENGVISFTTKPSGLVGGFSYVLDTNEGSLPQKVLGGVLGLTVNMSPRGERILFSQSLDGGFRTFSLNLDTRKTQSVSPATLPEKCVWSKFSGIHAYCGVPNTVSERLYPDEWYMGKVSFSDAIWKIDVSRGVGELLINPQNSNIDIDVSNPILSSDESYLLFINKKDSTLWSLEL